MRWGVPEAYVLGGEIEVSEFELRLLNYFHFRAIRKRYETTYLPAKIYILTLLLFEQDSF